MSTKICLNMIVKNESSIIERCLESVNPFINTWVIHDTGSIDNTRELIQGYFDKNKKPGVLTTGVVFKDFEFNRNAALQEATEQKGIDYVLFIDGDMELKTDLEPDEFWDLLKLPAYQISQKGSSLVYYNTRLLGKALFGTARYHGVTHEYLGTAAGPVGKLPHDSVYIQDHGDGGCKAEKFTRDQRLLEADVRKNPHNPRSWFYLAQTYKDLGKTDKAIETYRHYMKNPGWEEEGWYAQYMVSNLFRSKSDIANSLVESVIAYERRPHRAEPLYKLTELCRDKSWHRLGWQFALLGNTIEFPKHDSLFVETPVYAYRFLYELSILAYYVQRPSIGMQVSNNLLLTQNQRGGIPRGKITCIQRNMQFYLNPLPRATHQELKPENTPYGWNCMNPGLVVEDDHLLLNVRIVNYVMTHHCCYRLNVTHDQSGISVSNPIRTRNLRCTWKKGKLSSGNEFTPNDSSFLQYPNQCMGYEDVRLFRYNGQVWYSATVRQIVKSGLNSIVIGTDNKLFLLEGPTPGRCEKNWLPFEHKGNLLVIYQYDPLIIFKVNTKEGKCETFVKKDVKHSFVSFRGSGAPVKVPGGYYVIVHEVFPHYNFPRNYVHRVLFLSDDLDITHVSEPFKLKGDHHIEYVSGFAILGETAYITWGEMDAKAYITEMSVKDLEAFCKKDGPISELPLRLYIQ